MCKALFLMLSLAFMPVSGTATSPIPQTGDCPLCGDKNQNPALPQNQQNGISTIIDGLTWSPKTYKDCATRLLKATGQELSPNGKPDSVEFPIWANIAKDGKLVHANELGVLAVKILQEEKYVGTRTESVKRAEARFQKLTDYDFIDLFFPVSILVKDDGIYLSANLTTDQAKREESTMATILAADHKDAVSAFNFYDRLAAKGPFNTTTTFGVDPNSPLILKYQDGSFAKKLESKTIKQIITPESDATGPANTQDFDVGQFLEDKLGELTSDTYSNFNGNFYSATKKAAAAAPTIPSAVSAALESLSCQSINFVKTDYAAVKFKTDFCTKYFSLYKKQGVNECKCDMSLTAADPNISKLRWELNQEYFHPNSDPEIHKKNTDDINHKIQNIMEKQSGDSKLIEAEMITAFSGRSHCD